MFQDSVVRVLLLQFHDGLVLGELLLLAHLHQLKEPLHFVLSPLTLVFDFLQLRLLLRQLFLPLRRFRSGSRSRTALLLLKNSKNCQIFSVEPKINPPEFTALSLSSS
jgi:hypothetical protein